LFEVLTWRQLGLHDKPVFLVNVNAYWDPLLVLLKHVVAQGFADAALLDYFVDVPNAAAALEALP
ncbi:MAG: TIGR00730 family Rossman fold protein, partial [Tateyamaria sp.]|nr:TIGR00730 family Rossman fold protein [Tateyamaria sp.]